jgi:hypothetical protein
VSLQLAKKWLNDCVTGHASCTPEPQSDRWYPSRLLDLDEQTQDGPNSLRLITTSSHSLEGNYTTLSHRWGRAKFLQLTRHNLEALHRRIPIAELPQTFREAILVSKFLQIRYLWIDSLCIIQDNPSDWASEASQMHMVYSNSHCNISASHAEDSTKGLFRDRSPHALCSTGVHICTSNYDTTKKTRQVYVLANDYIIVNNMDSCPLSKRGWVLQERILAPRVLHFYRDQILLECRTRIACELYDTGMPNKYYSRFIEGSVKVNNAFCEKDKASWYGMWRTLVRKYSMMSLTYPSDKLAAILGVAKMVQSGVRDEYVAGMWRRYLVHQLIWSAKGSRIRPPAYRAPSWSWASVDGEVWFDEISHDLEMEAEIVDLHIEHATEDGTGQILSGWLNLKGSLQSVQLEHNTPSGEGWMMNVQDGDEGIFNIVAFFDDASMQNNIIVQQSAAAKYFCMHLATDWYMILRPVDHTNTLYERIGLAYYYTRNPGEKLKESLPRLRYHDRKQIIRII